ncbi:RNA methyltransferase [Thermosyntropha sp.]|uniref:RNA methyltransferase n=1 Tax=Thermosyntropha sp. TaxID=2740820 RepID=UPI0025F2BA13|nr:RNA methyltransferase [Thermosyntropha sp.]MBO8158648.1 RNA methyltransferase [Thermosyntropha sp.]
MRKSKVYIALLHYPMYNKRMDIITTSITNLDLHDIARAARTYDVDGFLVVHPSENQHALLKEIVSYWQEGYGGQYNPDRKEAFSILKTFYKLEEALEYIKNETGQEVLTVATDARIYPNTVSYRDLKKEIMEENKVFLILFGTGWGIQREIMESCNYILEPIEAERTYNHLSVRSAVAIILDRLLGEAWY